MISNLTPTFELILPLLFALLFSLNLTSSLQYQQAPPQHNLQIAKQWKLITYDFLPQQPVNDVNFYNPTNILITGIAISYDRIFIATPQLFSGVSSSVNVVSKTEFGDSPALQPYPDWSFSATGQSNVTCSDLKLISVYRMRIDSCNRLWALDAGVSRSLEDFEVTCPPKILVIDLKTNQVVRRIDFPKEILRGETLFTNLIVDETTATAGTCDDVFVYISDTVEPAIVVYDSSRDVTWRVSHPAMYPDPDFAESQIKDDKFILMDGIVGLTFDEKSGSVYFQPLATDRIFSVSKTALRAGPLPQNEALPVRLVGRKASQGIGLAVSPIDSSLIFSPMTETSVAAWNPTTNKQTILASDREQLQFVADMSTPRAEPGALYVVASKFQRFFLRNLDSNEINNRIIRLPLPQSEVLPPITHNFLPTVGATTKYSLNPLHSGYNFYQTNALHSLAADPTDYFTHAALSTKKFPYQFDQAGIVNYALRSPFAALNQGEAFMPGNTKRVPSKASYLDSLAGEGKATTARSPFALHTQAVPSSRGYYYQRHQ